MGAIVSVVSGIGSASCAGEVLHIDNKYTHRQRTSAKHCGPVYCLPCASLPCSGNSLSRPQSCGVHRAQKRCAHPLTVSTQLKRQPLGGSKKARIPTEAKLKIEGLLVQLSMSGIRFSPRKNPAIEVTSGRILSLPRLSPQVHTQPIDSLQ